MGAAVICGFNSSAPRREVQGPPCFSSHRKGVACIACSWDGIATCDKCDGKHTGDNCPHFRKDRDKHRDAWHHYNGKRDGNKKAGLSVAKGALVLSNPRVVCQPGDGSCLFHSLSYGLGNKGGGASSLRREIAGFILRNPSLEIADTPLQDWVSWDSGMPVTVYAAKMSVTGWGGGVEMAACARLKGVDVHVYEASRGSWRLISAFPGHASGKEATHTVRVAYQGRCHYDALVA